MYDNKEEIITELCAWLSAGKTLRSFCRQDGYPSYASVYSWLDDSEEFSNHIARARLIGHDAIADECVAIADDEYSPSSCKGEYKDFVSHQKLRIHTRLQLLSKWGPQKYGDKLQHSGDKENPVAITISREDAEF
jgi:hypothetical protein